jgi:NAD(P)-dependent dehydrogenase (short-subunit alcohol dehydrogenase family)
MIAEHQGAHGMSSDFNGKVVVITGGSRGIGYSIAAAFAAAGAEVVLAAASEPNLRKAADAIKATSGKAPAIVAGDLRQASACESLFEAVNARHGRCDILVNSAGATKAGAFKDLADDVWQDGFALKFFAAVRLCRMFWPMLAAAEGKIVNIIGGAARTPSAEFLIGGSVNAAFANFSKGLSALGRRDGVNVNVIHPGRTATDRTKDLFRQKAASRGVAPEVIEAEETAREGLRRIGQPEDIAALALFLCSPAASHIQGAAIAVDGGSTPGLH